MSLVINLDTSLDKSYAQPVALCLFEEKMPLHGCAGMIDWELCGELSRMIAGKRFVSKEKAKMLLYLRLSCMPERKVLVYGMGRKHTLTPRKMSLLTEDLMNTLSKLSIRSFVHAIPVLYGINEDIHGLLESVAYSILKFTSAAQYEYKLGLMWDNISQMDIVSSFKGAVSALPDASLSIIEKED